MGSPEQWAGEVKLVKFKLPRFTPQSQRAPPPCRHAVTPAQSTLLPPLDGDAGKGSATPPIFGGGDGLCL